MRIHLLNSSESRSYANKVLVFTLVILCFLLYMPTDASANGGGTKGGKTSRVIGPTPQH